MGRARHNAVTMKVLVVEDEAKAADYLLRGLGEQGYAVDVARNGREGLAFAEAGEHAIVLLDVMLPGLDGYQIVEALRRSGKRVPVLMLTAREDVDDRVRGLRAGADDYLVKPFAFSELLARMEALLRRAAGQAVAPTRLDVADLTLDLEQRRASRDGQRIDLSAKEFKLLKLLMRRRGQVLSRAILADQVWGMNFDSDSNVVEVSVRRLRAKIDDPFAPKLLHNVRGMGYVLEDRTR
jgi:two-component system, OmpR family, copper resistance phosphate regulon response regulator CusR